MRRGLTERECATVGSVWGVNAIKDGTLGALQDLDRSKSHFVFGSENESRWIMTQFESSDGCVYVTVKFGHKACAPNGTVHPGAITAIFDCVCYIAGLDHDGRNSPTAYLNVEFHHSMVPDTVYMFISRVIRQDRRKLFIESKAYESPDGQVLASAEGLFIISVKGKL